MGVSRGHQGQDGHAALHAGFRWDVPEHFNIAEVCCGRWAAGPDATKRIAIQAHGERPGSLFCSYAKLQDAANRLSNLLAVLGVARGDRVAIVLPQRVETAVAYMAVFQMGAVAVPLSMLFGPEALEYRLQDSGAVVALCDEGTIENLLAARGACPALRTVLGVGGAAGQADIDYELQTALQLPRFEPVATRADDGAVLIYTSGTTGPPKGALMPHRALIGNLSGFVCSQNWFGFDERTPGESKAVFWSPADWAWTGGLMDALLPTLYFGRPIVACNSRFSPELAFQILQDHAVTHTFLFPTALKAMMKACPRPRRAWRLKLQGLMSGGEAVGGAVFDWCRDALGVTVNEIFGQTEVNYVVGSCTRFWPARAGSMGRPYPGHRVAVIDDNGGECPVGVPGEVAVNRHDIHGDPDPVFFLGYWNNDAATRAKFTGGARLDGWCRTGDLALRDADGYLWYQGRADDVFKSSGYRIGPGEIENCLVRHPAVANAAVVPKPDRERGALVKAYVVLAPGFSRGQALVHELQDHVRGKLAPYEYPKEIEFIDALPMTTTGKVQRRVLRLQEEERSREEQGVPRVNPRRGAAYPDYQKP